MYKRQVIVATEVPEPTTVPTLPSPTATPVPAEPTQPPPQLTATPEPATAFVDVTMEDFEFISNNVTVKVGTTVTWRNVGNAPHSARSDDGQFDTGIYGNGEARSVVFDEPGTYQYYCELHGSPGGGGMAGVIVVEE